MPRVSKSEALAHLREIVGPDAEFRPQQWEAIDRLANDGERLLLVQRTGWGKSSVYFVATKVLREHGAGPTLVVSPLLSLMRNQIADAEADLGLAAATIHSGNSDEWDEVKRAVRDGDVDLLLISPERLANAEFRADVLAEIADDVGMLVIDEAHCISDWGHDFRPDYRRLGEVVERLPDGVPVAATTATANDRVVADVTSQLPGMESLRGSLMRESLRLQAVEFDDPAARLAWLAENLPETESSGIVYCLTHDDVLQVATWLADHGVDAPAYHGGLEGDRREQLEAKLMANEVDALVSTNALGMGFNKPDLGFVVHYQRPPNLVRYYQEIGRAGRNLEEAYAFVLSHGDDDDVAEYFIRTAFPSPEAFEAVLETVAASDEPLKRNDVLKRLDVSYRTAEKCLKILHVDGAVDRTGDGYVPTGADWEYDSERYRRVTEQRRRELERIQRFTSTDDCLMRFVDDELDGHLDEDCGQCANCAGTFVPDAVTDEALVEAAEQFFRDEGWQVIEPRSQLPQKGDTYRWIDDDAKLEPGRALSVYDDPGWGGLVREGIEESGPFDEDLVAAAADFVRTTWDPTPTPEWVTAVPSTSTEGLVADFAARLAARLGLAFVPAVEQVGEKRPQADFENSYQQCWNVQGAFEVGSGVQEGPVLLVDDTFGSRWTLTEVGRRLRRAGSGPVVPFALAERKRF